RASTAAVRAAGSWGAPLFGVFVRPLSPRHSRRWIERAHVYIACPPLYKVDVPGHGKRPAKKLYALDEEELKGILDRARDEGVRKESVSIQRFKGLGEMNPAQLWETALNPDTRRLLKVRIEDRDRTYALFNMLMSRKEAEKRCAWMEEKGNEGEAGVGRIPDARAATRTTRPWTCSSLRPARPERDPVPTGPVEAAPDVTEGIRPEPEAQSPAGAAVAPRFPRARLPPRAMT